MLVYTLLACGLFGAGSTDSASTDSGSRPTGNGGSGDDNAGQNGDADTKGITAASLVSVQIDEITSLESPDLVMSRPANSTLVRVEECDAAWNWCDVFDEGYQLKDATITFEEQNVEQNLRVTWLIVEDAE